MKSNGLITKVRSAEDGLSVAVLALMTVVPIAEALGREVFGQGVTGSIPLVQHLTFLLTFLGAALATRSRQLISMATPALLPAGLQEIVRTLTSAMAAGVCLWLAYVSVEVVRIHRESSGQIAWGIPVWLAVAFMPVGLTVIALRLVWTSSPQAPGRLFTLAVLILLLQIGLVWGSESSSLQIPILACLAVATILGLPIFAALGGAALVLFWSSGMPASVVALDTYDVSASELLPALPLFSLTGYLMAEGQAGKRLMRMFNALVGWAPGGIAIVVTLVLAFFTTLGSGVTILSLGGLILPVMTKAGYSEKSSIGLVTVGGSTGLLFPPSLPVILYGIQAGTRVDQLFLGGLIPGILLVGVVAAWGALRGYQAGAPRQPFALREAFTATWAARWDLLTPVIVLLGFFGGRVLIVEAAAISVVYALFVECVIFRELRIFTDIPGIAVECSTMVGGFLIILGVALGFLDYLNSAEIPPMIVEWVRTHISSPLVFLLVLNVLLVVVGAISDIYSAILVIVPLIVPIANHYAIDPVHLGVIFLTNMELGYLMPPMGENLFLSSIRFKRKLSWIYVSTLPYLILIVTVVLLVTYVPELTLAPVRWFR
jgi:C4-dicarboxylate transporter, DctM subunit